jgi:serine phosphatase RsbU (regulator of sigma subunit)
MDSEGGFPGGNRLSTDAGCSQEAAQDLAAGIADLLQELQQTRCALWQREAELAAGVPVTAHPDEQTHLAERLESVLKAGAQAVGCQAAAIYLLDDATRKLKLRACWGLPRSRFTDSPRPLRGATADLEALVGHAVIVRNAELLPNWQIPEEFHSAVCVPISSPTTPFGTLWVFCDHGRDFSGDETNLIEIVAGRIAADLERAVLVNQALKLRSLARQLTHAAQWQQHRLPRIKPLLSGWELSGWTAQAGALGGDFHDWFVLHGGDLAVAVGDAQGKMFESGLTTATLHTALRAHAAYGHTAQQVAERINETLWTASVGDQFASLFYANVQPETGAIEYVAAGHVYAAVVGDSVRTLAPNDALPLGTQPDGDYAAVSDRLERGEMLVAISDGVHRALRGTRERVLWRLMQAHRHLDADELIRKAREFLDRQAHEGGVEDQTILVVKRLAT